MFPHSGSAQAKSHEPLLFPLPDARFGCHPAAAPFWLEAAAIVLIFSFLGFFFSRLLLCSPLPFQPPLDDGKSEGVFSLRNL
jgi:hypothetical protein